VARARICKPDSHLLDALRPCMADDTLIESVRPYVSFDPAADPDGYQLRCISKQTIMYSCGTIAHGGGPTRHEHPTGEMARCRRLAASAAKVMRPAEAGMGSEGTAHWSPFFITDYVGGVVPKRLTETALRAAFGGCISPKTRLWIEPLAERGEWWSHVLHDSGDSEPADRERYLLPWRNMIRWFRSRPEFRTSRFGMIGKGGDDGAVFPRLAVGVTEAGSLVGIITHVVHS
jgi:hypothetical protein